MIFVFEKVVGMLYFTLKWLTFYHLYNIGTYNLQLGVGSWNWTCFFITILTFGHPLIWDMRIIEPQTE
jgi:hypothetical protein